MGVINPNVTTANSTSFKYKLSFFKTLTNDVSGVFRLLKILISYRKELLKQLKMKQKKKKEDF